MTDPERWARNIAVLDRIARQMPYRPDELLVTPRAYASAEFMLIAECFGVDVTCVEDLPDGVVYLKKPR